MKVGVLGAGGRMGRRILSAIVDAKHQIGGAVERGGAPEVGQDAGVMAGVAPAGVVVVTDLAQVAGSCDVWIDFSAPAATQANAKICADAGVAMVVGTTGMEGASLESLRAASKRIPVVHAANFSIGVNVLLDVVSTLAAKLEGYDMEVVEIHHRRKVDAPSGTALRLAQAAAEGRGQALADIQVTGRSGQVGARTDAELGVMAIRGGDVVGDHTVYFLGPGERIEVVHRAHSRDTFAAGAVRAAGWVAGRGPGLYDMRDVLGLKG